MRLRFVVPTLFLLAFAALAHADTFFSYKPTFGGGAESFTISDGFSPSKTTSTSFTIDGVSVMRGSKVSFQNITFSTILGLGGYTDKAHQFVGLPLFTGDVSSPTFLTGTFTLVDVSSFGAFGDLTISTVASQTPEPSSLALLGTGILGVVGAARRRFA